MSKAKADYIKKLFIDPTKLGEQEFGLEVIGDCMEPLLRNGSFVVVDLKQRPKAGEIVCIFYKPEFVEKGSCQAIVKRLINNLPSKLKFPYVSQKYFKGKADICFVESINPRKVYPIEYRKVLGIYRAFPADGSMQTEWIKPPSEAIIRRNASGNIAKAA